MHVQVLKPGPGDVGPGFAFAPGQGRNTRFDGGFHQLVVGRVKANLVDALTEAVVGVKGRFNGVGGKAGVDQIATAAGAVGS